MITRKKKIFLIQFTIFLIASLLLYNTYRDKDQKIKEEVKIEVETDADTNSFSDVEYSGFDLNGNRYTLNAGKADFETETPQKINMLEVVAAFYLKDGEVLKVTSDKGLYNNITLDMRFENNVKATYLTDTLISDQLIYSNSNAKLLVSGNVRGESIDRGEFFADNLEYNLANKTLNFSMFGSNQVNIKIKN
ncbi:LPS export ABC transporter periplasmic protein LptC [Pelagibacteraceae bacterium]|nr:LPS export ABC transporter periplasmic protein LptC [Pelagibacteraceae bacterium]